MSAVRAETGVKEVQGLQVAVPHAAVVVDTVVVAAQEEMAGAVELYRDAAPDGGPHVSCLGCGVKIGVGAGQAKVCRPGPAGPGTLCDRCGRQYGKVERELAVHGVGLADHGDGRKRQAAGPAAPPLPAPALRREATAPSSAAVARAAVEKAALQVAQHMVRIRGLSVAPDKWVRLYQQCGAQNDAQFAEKLAAVILRRGVLTPSMSSPAQFLGRSSRHR